MGGFGSGRRNTSSLGKVESHRSIDLDLLHQEGCLRAGWKGRWKWLRDGETVDSIMQQKPKGMWRRTFDRLVDRAILAEMVADDEYERRAERLEECIRKKG